MNISDPMASVGLTLPTLCCGFICKILRDFFSHVDYGIKRNCEEDGCSFLGRQRKKNTWEAEYILFLLQSVGVQAFLTFSAQSYI